MRYWAILKDSFYETIDFKLFYVLLGISTLIILLCFSIQFPLVSVADALVTNLDSHAGADYLNIDRQRRNAEPPARPGDAAAAVSDISPVPDRPGRYRFVLSPRTDEPAPGEPPPSEGAASAPSKERPKKNFGLAVQLVTQQRQLRKQAERGDVSPMALFKFLVPAKAPASSAQWKAAMTEYLDSIAGISAAEVLEVDGDTGKTPSRFKVEATIDDAKLPYRHQVGLFFGIWKIDIAKTGVAVFFIQSLLVDAIAGWVGLIVALIVTAGFVPSMLQKGTLDFLLVKPIHRPTLLLWKYCGGLFFVLFNGLFLVTGTWLAFGVNTGNWSPWYLLSVAVLVFFFAILYSLSVLVGVLTRSAMAAVLVTLGFWFVLFLVQSFYGLTILPDEIKPEFVKNFPAVLTSIIDWVHYLLPKPGQLSELNQLLLAEANQAQQEMLLQRASLTSTHINWTETIATSAGFIAVMLGLASWRFSRKDY